MLRLTAFDSAIIRPSIMFQYYNIFIIRTLSIPMLVRIHTFSGRKCINLRGFVLDLEYVALLRSRGNTAFELVIDDK